MALTVTSVIAAQSFGTSTNVGNDKFPTKLALQAGTVVFSVTVSITNGAAVVYDRNQRLRAYFTTSPLSSTAADAPTVYGLTSQYLDVVPSLVPGGISAVVSPSAYVAGGFFYCWVTAPNLPAAATFTVTLVETPIT